MARHRGLTLVEILVTASLLTVVLGGLFALSRGGERATHAAVIQADCLRQANLFFRQMRRLVQRSETVFCPGPGEEAPCLVLRGWNGAPWVVRLAPTHQHVLIVDEATERANCLVKLTNSTAYFARLYFACPADGQLTAHLSFCDDKGQSIKGCTALVAQLGRAVSR